jgi:hypothetical protein
MEKKLITIVALSIALFYTDFIIAQDFFSHKIKGDKSEYNVRSIKISSSYTSYTISNINNTWGTDKFPKNTVEYGGGLYSKEDYINVYKIIKNTLDPKDFQILMTSEKINNAYAFMDMAKLERLNKVGNGLSVFIVFSPNTGKVFEVFFSMQGDIFKNMSPDYFFEIEREIKEKIILNINWKDYMLCKFSYLFNDLDSKTIKGERIILSEIQ